MSLTNPYLPRQATVNAVKNESLETKTLRLKLQNWSMSFVPGQFVQLLLPGVGEAPFCIASSPRDQRHIEITIMRRGMLTNAAHYLRPGDALGIRGPLGRPFPIDQFEGKGLLIIATGIGIAALKSLIEHVVDNRSKYGEVTLLYGARFPEDLVYREDMKHWSSAIKIIVTLSKATPEWQGLRGRVTDHLRGINLDDDMNIAICGSPTVMASIVQSLSLIGINKDRIFVSLERHMKCGIGKCARCLIAGGKMVCKDGPVFKASEISLEAIGE